MTLAEFTALRRAGRDDDALALIVRLAAADPADAAVQYEAACLHDALGREAEAVAYYERALAGRLDPEQRRSALLGLGSTCRVLGDFARAEETLRQGLAEFPLANEFPAFLAMVEHNLGRSKRAVEVLLRLLAETTADPAIGQYRRAIAFYAEDIDRTWPGGA